MNLKKSCFLNTIDHFGVRSRLGTFLLTKANYVHNIYPYYRRLQQSSKTWEKIFSWIKMDSRKYSMYRFFFDSGRCFYSMYRFFLPIPEDAFRGRNHRFCILCMPSRLYIYMYVSISISDFHYFCREPNRWCRVSSTRIPSTVVSWLLGGPGNVSYGGWASEIRITSW